MQIIGEVSKGYQIEAKTCRGVVVCRVFESVQQGSLSFLVVLKDSHRKKCVPFLQNARSVCSCFGNGTSKPQERILMFNCSVKMLVKSELTIGHAMVEKSVRGMRGCGPRFVPVDCL